MTRKEHIKIFLEKIGWGAATITPLAGDASFRRYDRITLGDKKAVLMDAPPEFEDTRPFVAIAEYLIKCGLNAPQIFAKDFDRGLLLIQDHGDDLFKRVLDVDPQKERKLYLGAVDELLKINSIKPPRKLPHGDGDHILCQNDMDMLLSDILLFSDWYYPALTGKKLSFVKRTEFIDLWRDVLIKVSSANECLVLRDYHAENLLDLPGEKIGQLDFQDAVIGHSAYDLVSLLQDARRDVDPEIEDEMIRYFTNNLQRDETLFREHYAILGAQRNIKIIGIFARLFHRDGKDNYLKLIPRVWGLLERCLQHLTLGEIKKWLDNEVPDKRDVALAPIGTGPHHAMILAAGLGKRMKPLTDNIPKPLIKIAGKEMLSYTLDALAGAGVKNAVINKHHFADQIESYVENRLDWRPMITLSDETDELLDSGGGVKKALGKLGSDPFYILNSDMIWSSDKQDTLGRLATEWRDDMDIVMLLIKRDEAFGHDGPGDFHMNEAGQLKFRGDDELSDYLYGGILIIRPECFDNISENIFSLRKIFKQVAAKGRLYGLLHEGSWYHVGTPESVIQTEQLLKGE
ncbi:MAG: phosphotransferase [Emcibacteraceae bacterium]|nr:phosphotransferase [Emcibacteraceae bacterium]